MKRKPIYKAMKMTAIAALVITLSGCSLLPKEEELPTAPLLVEADDDEYVVSPVVRGDVRIVEVVRANCLPSATERLDFALGDEKISKVYIELGDTVQAGDVLMELDVTDINDQIRQQEDQIASLSLQLQHLYEQEAIGLQQAQLQDDQAAENSTVDYASRVDEVYDQYSGQARQLQNDISIAELRLEELLEEKSERQLIASISGTVTYLYEFEEGERSEKGKKIITISDMSQPLFEVYSENGSLLEPGKTYTLMCQDVAHEVVARTGAELNLQATKPEGMYLVLTTPDPNIEQGMSGLVELVLQESLNTLYITNSAIKDLRGESIVYTVDDQGYREMRAVKTGLATSKVTEITEGLAEGEVVIIE